MSNTNCQKISVIVPVYNVENYLDRCLKSITEQEYENLEIILIDDGSTDSSLNICKEYEKKDSRVKIITQENKGVSAARNAGLDIATGDYIGFVDSDDWIDKDMYKELMGILMKYDADIVACAYRQVRPDKTLDFSDNKETVYSGIEMFKAYINGSNMMSPAIWNRLFKAEIFDGIRFDDVQMYEDKIISCKTLIRCKKGVFYNKALYNYRYTKGSLTHSINSPSKMDDYIFANHFQLEKVKENLSYADFVTASGVYYLILLDNYCMEYNNTDFAKYKMKLETEAKCYKTEVNKYLNDKKDLSRIDKTLIQISFISFALYYFMNKVVAKIHK